MAVLYCYTHSVDSVDPRKYKRRRLRRSCTMYYNVRKNTKHFYISRNRNKRKNMKNQQTILAQNKNEIRVKKNTHRKVEIQAYEHELKINRRRRIHI